VRASLRKAVLHLGVALATLTTSVAAFADTAAPASSPSSSVPSSAPSPPAPPAMPATVSRSAPATAPSAGALPDTKQARPHLDTTGNNPLVPSAGTIPVSGKPIGSSLPRRHQGTQLVWDPKFDRMDLPEMVVTGAAAAVALAANIAPPLKTGWTGGIGFDNAVRSALRPGSFQARLDARDTSDVGLGVIVTFPILVDSLIVAYWYRGSDDVALQMGLIDLEALTIAGAIQGTANFFGGRLRPYGEGCGTQIPNDTQDCQSTSKYRSFFSGHSTVSFTSASLICAHHEALHLFESSADEVTCVSAYVAAASIATLRVVGDVHYASDVLIGAVVGTTVGLTVPLLHHYRREAPTGGKVSDFHMRLVPSMNGAAVVGTF
jgi:membrane-associated phospholipid phosphatase